MEVVNMETYFESKTIKHKHVQTDIQTLKK